jgi:hypothetical protein
MSNANNKMVEFVNVVVVIRGEEVDLSELTYNEFSEIMNSLEDEEIADVLDQIVEQAGEEAFLSFVIHLQELAEEELEEAGVDPQEAGLQKLNIKDMSELDEDLAQKAEVKHEQQRPTAPKQKAPVLDPIKFVDMNDFYNYDAELIGIGIDEVSIEVGKYLAYVNAGLTNEQAYELITIESKRQHELEMANKQLELERIKVEAQMRTGAVKQLLNR